MDELCARGSWEAPRRYSKMVKYCSHENNRRLVDLPEDLLREILRISLPRQDKKKQDYWLWLLQVGGVCKVFHEITKDFTPDELNVKAALQYLPSSAHWTPFLRSFLQAPWKGSKLKELRIPEMNDFQGEYETDQIPVLRQLLTEPSILSNLEIIEVSHDTFFSSSVPLVDPTVLLCISQNFQNLRSLHVDVQWPCGTEMTVHEMSLMASNLRSLEYFGLIHAYWMKDDHVESFVSAQPNLRTLRLEMCVMLTDSTLASLARTCRNLESLDLSFTEITDRGMETFLLACGSRLTALNISGCSFLTWRIVEMLIQYSPNMQTFDAHDCGWWTDSDIIDRLAYGEPYHWPLTKIDIGHVPISDKGISILLQVCGSTLTTLNLSGCRSLSSRVVDLLVRHAPNICDFNARDCPWLSDAGLDRLIQGHLDHRIGQPDDASEIPLCHMSAISCHITKEGAQRAIRKKGIGKIEIIGLGWSIQGS